MKFIHLSDTHGKHHELPKLPTADMIIHSGDVSMAGTGKEVNEKLINCFEKLRDVPYERFRSHRF